jgi:hypothetical protein
MSRYNRMMQEISYSTRIPATSPHLAHCDTMHYYAMAYGTDMLAVPSRLHRAKASTKSLRSIRG